MDGQQIVLAVRKADVVGLEILSDGGSLWNADQIPLLCNLICAMLCDGCVWAYVFVITWLVGAEQ